MCFETIISHPFRYPNWICYTCELPFVYYPLLPGIPVMPSRKHSFELFVAIVLMIKSFWMDMAAWLILMSIDTGIWDYSAFNPESIIGFVGRNCSSLLVMWGIYSRSWRLCCPSTWLSDALTPDLFLTFLESQLMNIVINWYTQTIVKMNCCIL